MYTHSSISFALFYGHFPDLWNILFQLFFLRPTIKSFIQGFLPGIALKIFLILLPSILMFMSKVEGLTSISSLERRSASKYYIFIFFNVFLASIIAGSALEQLKTFLRQSANEYVLILSILYAAPFIIVLFACTDIGLITPPSSFCNVWFDPVRSPTSHSDP